MPEVSKSAYNQTGSKDDSPEVKDPYIGKWPDVMKNHMSSENASLEETVNSKSGEGLMGHGAPGELHANSKGGPRKSGRP